MAERDRLTGPPPQGRGGCGINPAVILFGMVVASTFSWFFGSGRKQRQATRFPRYTLGDQVEGREVTAIRSTWEYQFDDGTQWVEENT
jgi:hypothetical protein